MSEIWTVSIYLKTDHKDAYGWSQEKKPTLAIIEKELRDEGKDPNDYDIYIGRAVL